MGQTTNQIEHQIEIKREDLKSNLEELEHRVKSATDWRQYYEKHVGTAVAAAFGGGLLLSAMLAKGTNPQTQSAHVPAGDRRPTSDSGAKHEVLETFDTVRNALVGVATTKFKGILAELVPGFSEHLAEIERKRGVQGHSTGNTPTM